MSKISLIFLIFLIFFYQFWKIKQNFHQLQIALIKIHSYSNFKHAKAKKQITHCTIQYQKVVNQVSQTKLGNVMKAKKFKLDLLRNKLS